jgi:hypothetical protein
MYLYKGATTYPAISTSTSIFILIYIKRKPYARICCILDYLNVCVLQKRSWPNSINSSKYTKLRCYWIVVNFTIITELVECITELHKTLLERHTINSNPRFATNLRTAAVEGSLLLVATCSPPCPRPRVDLVAGSLLLLVVVVVATVGVGPLL